MNVLSPKLLCIEDCDNIEDKLYTNTLSNKHKRKNIMKKKNKKKKKYNNKKFSKHIPRELLYDEPAVEEKEEEHEGKNVEEYKKQLVKKILYRKFFKNNYMNEQDEQD